MGECLLRYSPEGRHLFTLNANGTVYVLRLAEGPAVDEATRARFAAPLPPREADPVYTPAGDWAVEFNGKTTLGTGPYVPLDKSEQFTAEAWVRDWTGNVFHTGDQSDPENSIWLHKDWANGIRLNGGWEREDGSVNEEQKLWLPNTRSAGWMHLAMVYDGNVQRVFVNGKLAGEQVAKRPGESLPDHGFLIGNLPGLAATPAHTTVPGQIRGQMSQLRFSNTARYTASFTPATRLDSDAATLALYHFNAGKGSVVRDLSPHARDLALKDHSWRDQTPPQPPLDELLKDAKWTTLVDGDGKIVAESRIQQDWEPIADANRGNVEITEGTTDGLRLKGADAVIAFPMTEMNRLVIRARVTLVKGHIAVGTISVPRGESASINFNGEDWFIWMASPRSAGQIARIPDSEFELVLRLDSGRVSAYVNGQFFGSYEGELPLGVPYISVDSEGTFRNVEVLVLPDDE